MENRLNILKDSGSIDSQICKDVLFIYNEILPKYKIINETAHTFLTHLAMALMRIHNRNEIPPIDIVIQEEIRSNINFLLAKSIVEQISSYLDLLFSDNEAEYLYLHLCILLNDVETDILISGYTLMHEHITIDLSYVKNNLDCKLDCFNQTLTEMKELYNCGVRNIVDVTLPGMARDVKYVQRIEEASQIRVISATGYYKEPFLPSEVETLSTEELAQKMIDEIHVGIEGTNQRAYIIGEIGSSKSQMMTLEKKVFDASIIAAKKTNVPITTHTTLGTFAIEQAKYLLENGIRADKIIIGHQDLSANYSQILELINLGVYVGFDTVGKINYVEDVKRAEILLALQNENKLCQVILSMDITRKSHLKANGGLGYAYMFTDFLPLLKSMGITEESINLMLKENPETIFRGGKR